MNHETHVPNGLETGIGVLANLIAEVIVGGRESVPHEHQPIKGVLIVSDGTQLPITSDLPQHSHHTSR